MSPDTPTSAPILELRDLTVDFGGVRAVTSFNMAVAPGERVALERVLCDEERGSVEIQLSLAGLTATGVGQGGSILGGAAATLSALSRKAEGLGSVVSAGPANAARINPAIAPASSVSAGRSRISCVSCIPAW